MSLSPSRVASRHLQAGDEVWLPDYLGAGAPVVDAAVRLLKEIVVDSSEFPQNRTSPQAAAGGLFYHMLRDSGNLEEDAKRMWQILDRNAGLHAGGNMWRFAERVYRAAMRGVEVSNKAAKALRIGAMGVELLQRTRQMAKAKVVNEYFVKKYGDALAAMQPGRSKGLTPADALNEAITPEMGVEAQRVAALLDRDVKKAVSFIRYICTDSNFHDLASGVEGVGPSTPLSEEETDAARDISGFVEYTGKGCAAFGVALFAAMGATALANKFGAVALRVGKDLFSNRLAGDAYTGNPDGQGIYPNEIDHGYTEPLAGGTDVMRRLQNQFRHEQGREQRPESPRLAAEKYRTTAVRSPYYSMGDGVIGLTSAVQSEPVLSKDEKLRTLLRNVSNASDAIYKHLEKTYIWD